MRRCICIIVLTLTLSSCVRSKIKVLEGSWRLDFDETVENQHFPLELCFLSDTLYMIDGYNFQHKTKYRIENDSMELVFSNGDVLELNIEIYTDSTICFSDANFFKIPLGFESILHPYDLLGYKTGKTISDTSYDYVIHLIKFKSKPQVILNDITTNLDDIPDFLNSGHAPNQLNLYLGYGIELNDLLEAYKWIRIAGIKVVVLVTGNESFYRFYIVNDYISLDDSLFNSFLNEEDFPSFPLSPNEKTKRNIIEVKNHTDLEKLMTMNDSTEYLIKIDNQFDIIGYFKLIEDIRGKKNIRKELTDFSCM